MCYYLTQMLLPSSNRLCFSWHLSITSITQKDIDEFQLVLKELFEIFNVKWAVPT